MVGRWKRLASIGVLETLDCNGIPGLLPERSSEGGMWGGIVFGVGELESQEAGQGRGEDEEVENQGKNNRKNRGGRRRRV